MHVRTLSMCSVCVEAIVSILIFGLFDVFISSNKSLRKNDCAAAGCRLIPKKHLPPLLCQLSFRQTLKSPQTIPTIFPNYFSAFSWCWQLYKSLEMQSGCGVLPFVPALWPQIRPARCPSLSCFAPGCAPLCDGSSNSEKRSAGIRGRHTGPSGARNARSGAHKATGRGAHLSEIIRCLCLPGLWQVDQLGLWRRPSESHYDRLSSWCTQPYCHSCCRHIC